jgi:hypothetical protein
MSENKADRSQIVEVITAPLGFFVLALLIIEGFLAIVLAGASLDRSDKIFGMYFGVGLFIFVTLIVAVLVWFKPDNLTFDKEAHLRDRGKPPFGSDRKTLSNEDPLIPTEPNRNLS